MLRVKLTGFGVVGANTRGTERRLQRSTFSGTTGSLAASRRLDGVVFEAARDVDRLVGVGEHKVEEQDGE